MSRHQLTEEEILAAMSTGFQNLERGKQLGALLASPSMVNILERMIEKVRETKLEGVELELKLAVAAFSSGLTTGMELSENSKIDENAA